MPLSRRCLHSLPLHNFPDGLSRIMICTTRNGKLSQSRSSCQEPRSPFVFTKGLCWMISPLRCRVIQSRVDNGIDDDSHFGGIDKNEIISLRFDLVLTVVSCLYPVVTFACPGSSVTSNRHHVYLFIPVPRAGIIRSPYNLWQIILSPCRGSSRLASPRDCSSCLLWQAAGLQHRTDHARCQSARVKAS